jgi:4-amino-4-deoxy-L-arabinose transferase-like glycosyltransferase
MSGVASKASSDVPAAGSAIRIPALPGLGTTWYERGARYWLRRALSAFLWLAVLAFFCYIALRLYQSFRGELPPTVRMVWDWLQVVASCAAVVWGWVVQRRDHRKKLLDPPTPDQAREAKRRGTGRSTGLAVAGRFLLVIAAPVLPAFAAFCAAWTVAAFTVREYPSEVGARRTLQE